MSKKAVPKSDSIVDDIVSRLSAGETLVAICKSNSMPTVRAVNMWCAADTELDDRIFRARQRGILIQSEEALDVQRAISNGEVEADSKTLHARITAANAIAHQALAKLSKLDNRYKEKREVEHTGGSGMIIGWASEFAQKTADPPAIDLTPEIQSFPELETELHGGEARKIC